MRRFILRENLESALRVVTEVLNNLFMKIREKQSPQFKNSALFESCNSECESLNALLDCYVAFKRIEKMWELSKDERTAEKFLKEIAIQEPFNGLIKVD